MTPLVRDRSGQDAKDNQSDYKELKSYVHVMIIICLAMYILYIPHNNGSVITNF